MTSLDVSQRASLQLDRLDNHLAYVVAVHLFVEYLIDRVILAGSKLSPAETRKRILEDRNYTFAIKLTIALQMGALPAGLYENIRALNRLRNKYAHEIDVNLGEALFSGSGFILRDGGPAFNPAPARQAVEADPKNSGLLALQHVRHVTFDWLLSLCREQGISTV